LQAGVSCCLAIEDSWATIAASELRSCGLRTGPSGAAGIAGLLAVFSGPFAGSVREHLGLFSDAQLLVVATEAATASDYAQHAALGQI
jgi:diaminopropionate ammonia-lyase